ncbi:MAG: hypothetical protein M0P71_07275 [Melioribacteraceae bacterium]|jgi:hypothetical protein|nr:hypothetical protein [Melioribacteraceae bacterium]MDD3982845.1 hypothetical protein [Candidatus Omnitrophota bacterium]
MHTRIVTKVKSAVNKAGKKICVPAQYISIDQAESLGVDLSKIKPFTQLCKEAGFKEIIVGSTTKEINFNGGQNMPKHRFPKVESLSDLGFMGQVKGLIPTKQEGINMAEGLASMLGALMVSNFTVNKIEQDWLRIALKVLLAVGGSKAANRYANEQVGIGIFAGFGIDAVMEIAAKFNIQLPVSFAVPVVAENATTPAVSGLGQLKLNRQQQMLFGVQATRPKNFQGFGEIETRSPVKFGEVVANEAQPFMGSADYQPYSF